MNIMKRLFAEEEGQGLVEYALILGLIAIVVIGVLTTMSDTIKGIFDKISAELTSAGSKANPKTE